MKKQRDRDETFWLVLNAALELDFRKGHLKWTMSELSRRSGITRSLVYYHFGRSKLAILEEAVQVIGEQIIGLTPERLEMWRQGDWKKAVLASRAIIEQSPSLVNFYLLHRDRPTEIGQHLRKLESNYQQKLEMLFPHLPPAAHGGMFAFFFGVIFAPAVDETAIAYALAALKALTTKPAQSKSGAVSS
ncbi:MAG: helix-turn-helix domain-containing protein [Bdellovibrionota bacterium]